jgi:hypothetical protein
LQNHEISPRQPLYGLVYLFNEILHDCFRNPLKNIFSAQSNLRI